MSSIKYLIENYYKLTTLHLAFVEYDMAFDAARAEDREVQKEKKS